MTVLGKMLVFLVLLLSLVWNGLVVNAYVTRSNWRAEVKKYQDKAVEAADSANNVSKLLAAERDAKDDSERAIREDRDRLYAQIAEAQKQIASLTKQIADKLAADQLRGGDENKLLANNKSLLEQVDNLTKTLGEKEGRLNELNLSAERARAEMVRAQLEAAQQQQRADRLNEQLQNAQEQIRDARLGSAGPRDPLAPRVTPPQNFRGTIRSREGDLVSFTPGADAGLQAGARLTVYRLTPAPKYLGSVVVTIVDPKVGVGKFVPPPGVRLGADDYPKPNDELKAN